MKFEYLLYDSKHNYIGTLDDAPLSKAKSFDVYINGQFLTSDFIPPKLKVAQKIVLFKVFEREIKNKLKAKRVEKKESKYRQLYLSLPPSTDYKLYDSNMQALGPAQFSKAKYFGIFVKSEKTKRFKLVDKFKFTVKSSVDKQKELQEIAQTIMPDKEKIEGAGIVKNWDYILTESLPYIRRDKREGQSKYIKMEAKTPMVLKVAQGRIDEKDFKKFEDSTMAIVEKNYSYFDGETNRFSFRSKIKFLTSSGKEMHRWISTSRYAINKKDFRNIAYNELMADLYAAAVKAYMDRGISEFSVSDFEVEYVNYD